MAKSTNKKTKLMAPEAATLFTVVDPMSNISEQFRTIRTNILYSSLDSQTQSIIVTSAGPSEGKSTTSANLAIAFAQSGMKTILVDADLRRPTVHRSFDTENNKGLSSLLSIRRMSLGEVIQPSDVRNLDLITSSPISPNPSELLASSRMRKVLHILKQEYDFIIFDVPPVGTVTDAQLIASQVDGAVFVVREEQTEKAGLERAAKLIEQVDSKILGTVYMGELTEQNYGYYQS
ncbi:CpsD/CapB family tyrosine-protein kinase [Vagococcus sp. DIV0080]|uniref:Tyrosine-protein kinase CpsD n=1 Tax=Candidatus Vagococcus giribetii TaxID=2230876 RepID=A0ABS3HUQ3_9ENTE|nr:CpsD/CapB family tyrosine-protein kinase [Vagococcus sp. DIV0080]MBO0477439.1 CpsD/CapB family tyrosine-protein kinase [Vagococcus sp. DIV0080]